MKDLGSELRSIPFKSQCTKFHTIWIKSLRVKVTVSLQLLSENLAWFGV